MRSNKEAPPVAMGLARLLLNVLKTKESGQSQNFAVLYIANFKSEDASTADVNNDTIITIARKEYGYAAPGQPRGPVTTKPFFAYNLTKKSIIGFERTDNLSLRNLNTILACLEHPGIFSSSYGRVGYPMVYQNDCLYYDDKMQLITINLDEATNDFSRQQQTNRYNDIRHRMTTGEVLDLAPIGTTKVWMQRIDNSWYACSSIDDIKIALNFNQAFASASRIDSKDREAGTKIFKTKYTKHIEKQLNTATFVNWHIKLRHTDLTITKLSKQPAPFVREENPIWSLDTKGPITLDSRIINKEQALDLIAYLLRDTTHISSGIASNASAMPDVIRNTPVNIYFDPIVPSSYTDYLNQTGHEMRITSTNNNQFQAVTEYGKECDLSEFDVDQILRDGVVYEKVFGNFIRAEREARAPIRANILDAILPGLKLKTPVSIINSEKGLVIAITNNDGAFEISLRDGKLSMLKPEGGTRYICVGSKGAPPSAPIIYQGKRIDSDDVLTTALSLMVMIATEKYPDHTTSRQIKPNS
jgi:hypothetical protein